MLRDTLEMNIKRLFDFLIYSKKLSNKKEPYKSNDEFICRKFERILDNE